MLLNKISQFIKKYKAYGFAYNFNNLQSRLQFNEQIKILIIAKYFV